MHEHWSVPRWIAALSELKEDAGDLGGGCPRARELWNEDLGSWMEHAARCPRCRRIVTALELVPDEILDCRECRSSLEVVYDMVDELEHFDPVVALELPRAEAMVEELNRLPLDAQIEKVIEDLPYRQWGVCQRLLSEAKQAWLNDPRLAHDRAVLAVVVAERLLEDDYDARWIADLQAKSHAYLANAFRILGRFQSAEHELQIAEAKLGAGVGSLSEEARVLGLRASLLRDQSRNREALALLDRVERIYRERNDRHQAGRTRLQRARALASLDRPLEAAEECDRAAVDLDARREPDLPVLARQNAVFYLIEAGDLEHARRLFDRLPPIDERLLQIKRGWIEADLLRAEGRLLEARQAYDLVRQEFGSSRLHFDAAVVTLDLALTAFEQGDTAAVKRMAEEASVLLTRAEAKQEAFAALSLLFRAVEAETLTLATLEQVRGRLARVKPS